MGLFWWVLDCKVAGGLLGGVADEVEQVIYFVYLGLVVFGPVDNFWGLGLVVEFTGFYLG